MRPTRILVTLIALGLVVGACSPDDAAETTSSASTVATTRTTDLSTTSSSATTSTSSGPEFTSLVNGLPVDDPALLQRRVLAVKIDNHPRANPQSGINHADMVVELMVEGITRYLTIWHESDTDYLGPMRSGRPTDPTLLRALNEPSFAISGAQAWVQSLIRSKDVHLIGEAGPPMTFRISSRSAPHNLYVNTSELRNYADGRDYPDDPPSEPLWSFGPMSPDAEPAIEATLDFSGNTVIWTWDESSGTWQRTGYGHESMYRDEDGTEARIGVPVMIALYVEMYTASPPAGVSGTTLPSSHTTGSGKAYVFSDGKVSEGTWERQSEQEWFTLTDAEGNTMTVPPGRSWLSLVPAGGGLTYR